jgi:tRNA(Arg) A34 adenosine deaminase TadA
VIAEGRLVSIFLLGVVVGATALAGLLGLLLTTARRGAPLEPEVFDVLQAEATTAIEHRDVPVAAVVVYAGEIIGRGRNRMNERCDAGGHAEIAAITDAIGRLGHDRFGALDRDQLFLASTWEPCAMCRGAAIVHRIEHVVIATKKPWREAARERRAEIRHFLRRRQSGPDAMQQRLNRAYYDVHGRPRDL